MSHNFSVYVSPIGFAHVLLLAALAVLGHSGRDRESENARPASNAASNTTTSEQSAEIVHHELTVDGSSAFSDINAGRELTAKGTLHIRNAPADPGAVVVGITDYRGRIRGEGAAFIAKISDGSYQYEVKVTSPLKPGTCNLEVKHGNKVIDQKRITVKSSF